LGMSGTCLGAAYENMPYLCDKENERSNAELLNQGGTAGVPVPMGIGVPAFCLRKGEKKMAKDKKLVEAITSMDTDFAQWYTDVVKKAELIAYSSVKGCMVIKPAGYAIWENIQKELDARFKATGVENVYMPMFIPESLLEKEKDHVEGFCTGGCMGNTWWFK